MAASSVDLSASFERHLCAENKSARTIQTYLGAVLAGLLARWTPATAANRYRALRVFYAWLEEEGEIPADPMAKMKPPRVPEQPAPVLTEDMLRRLLATCTGRDFQARRDRALVLLLLDTGGRLAEIAGMRLGDLNFEYDVVIVVGKGGRERALPASRPAGRSTSTSAHAPATPITTWRVLDRPQGPRHPLRRRAAPPPAALRRHRAPATAPRSLTNVRARLIGGSRLETGSSRTSRKTRTPLRLSPRQGQDAVGPAARGLDERSVTVRARCCPVVCPPTVDPARTDQGSGSSGRGRQMPGLTAVDLSRPFLRHMEGTLGCWRPVRAPTPSCGAAPTRPPGDRGRAARRRQSARRHQAAAAVSLRTAHGGRQTLTHPDQGGP